MAPQTGLEPVTPSVKNIVALFRLERSYRSLFFPVQALPASAAGSGNA